MKSFKTNRVGARAAGPFQDVWKPEPQDQLVRRNKVDTYNKLNIYFIENKFVISI